jgi:CheY-like chemotaxis protein
VLIVEDNIVNQKVLSKLVTSLGALVKCVENGALAVEACKSESVDVVFMDVEMPVMNGLDATRAIRALPGGAKIPIVGVSANAAPEEQERGLAAGMTCYLPKPVRKDQITAVIASIAKNRSPSLRALSG